MSCTYYAILIGNINEKNQIINAPISRKENSIIERVVNPNGDIAISHLEVIKNFDYQKTQLAFVKYILETGRTHQLRVHSQYIGHPILGDTLYGFSSEFIERQALHAFKITFVHPIEKKICTFESPIPNDMKKIIN